jgi:hypothetical protein
MSSASGGVAVTLPSVDLTAVPTGLVGMGMMTAACVITSVHVIPPLYIHDLCSRQLHCLYEPFGLSVASTVEVVPIQLFFATFEFNWLRRWLVSIALSSVILFLLVRSISR